MMIREKDRNILRKLASEQAEIAALPVHKEKIELWKKLNGLEPVRPMVMIDQVCWNEMNVNDELTLLCEDEECRRYEGRLRRTLYQWRHFPVDMVVDPFIRVFKTVDNSGFGIKIEEDVAVGDPSNSVVGHAYKNQFETDADLDKIKVPQVEYDQKETARRMEFANEVFSGILDVVECGFGPYLSVWDPISMWMSVEDALYAMVDRPEYMKELVRRMVNGYMKMLDQLEEQGLLFHHQPVIHCTGAYTDELPAPGFDPDKPRTKDVWMFGLAQMLGTVSPAMYEEFEIDVCMPLFERFGLVYYGCCDPLDKKIKEVTKIPNVRKISISPWADEEVSASQLNGGYVYSRKPNPAMLAWEKFDEGKVKGHLQTTVDICERNGCPLELILKDISTVSYEPQRLWKWADIAMEVVNG